MNFRSVITAAVVAVGLAVFPGCKTTSSNTENVPADTNTATPDEAHGQTPSGMENDTGGTGGSPTDMGESSGSGGSGTSAGKDTSASPDVSTDDSSVQGSETQQGSRDVEQQDWNTGRGTGGSGYGAQSNDQNDQSSSYGMDGGTGGSGDQGTSSDQQMNGSMDGGSY